MPAIGNRVLSIKISPQELDTTLQVLGIDGSNDSTSHRVTASPHAPLLPAGKQKRPDTDSAPLEAAFASRLR